MSSAVFPPPKIQKPEFYPNSSALAVSPVLDTFLVPLNRMSVVTLHGGMPVVAYRASVMIWKLF